MVVGGVFEKKMFRFVSSFLKKNEGGSTEVNIVFIS